MGRLLVGGRRGGVHPSALVSAQTQGPLLLIRDLRWGELAQSVAIFSERGNISPGVRKREGTGWQEGGDWLVSLSREEPQAEGRACLWERWGGRLSWGLPGASASGSRQLGDQETPRCSAELLLVQRLTSQDSDGVQGSSSEGWGWQETCE